MHPELAIIISRNVHWKNRKRRGEEMENRLSCQTSSTWYLAKNWSSWPLDSLPDVTVNHKRWPLTWPLRKSLAQRTRKKPSRLVVNSARGRRREARFLNKVFQPWYCSPNGQGNGNTIIRVTPYGKQINLDGLRQYLCSVPTHFTIRLIQ